MTNILHTNRATGRTQRMLEEVLAQARKGEPVTVLAADQGHLAHLKRRITDLAVAEGCEWAIKANVCFYPVTHPSITEYRPGEYRHQFGRKDEKIFIDHYVLEKNYWAAIENWLRWQ